MMFDAKPAAQAPLSIAQIVRNLIDHLPPPQRAGIAHAQDRIEVDLYNGRDGWLVARVTDWDRFDVLLKREIDLLQYQCSCTEFRTQAPIPCAHIVLAALAAAEDGVLDQSSSLAGKYPNAVLKPLVPTRPVASISQDGSIRLLRQNGQPVLREKKLPLPWKPYFQMLRASPHAADAVESWPKGRELLYVIDPKATLEGNGLILETMFRERKKDGQWRKPAPLAVSSSTVETLRDESDGDLIGRLVGCAPVKMYGYGDEPVARRKLSSAQARALLPALCQTGRCLLRLDEKRVSSDPLRWDGPDAWQLVIDVVRDESIGMYRISGHLERNVEHLSLQEPILLTSAGHSFLSDRVAPLQDFGAFQWIAMLRDRGEIRVPLAAEKQLLGELYQAAGLPRLNLPDELAVQEVSLEMRPRLKLSAVKMKSWMGDIDRVQGQLEFEYGETIVKAQEPPAVGILQASQRRLIRREQSAEAAAHARLRALGFRLEWDQQGKQSYQLNARRMPEVIRVLIAEGWYIEAEGKLYRQPGEFRIEVSSGIDWFDLTARVDFDGQSAALPTLLAALRKGENVVRLDDGTFGILPEQWLRKYGGLASVGTVQDEKLRFARSQVGLLDALLASQPQARFDETFGRIRDELRAFSGVTPLDPPPTFNGQLRGYQSEALGWFEFLRRFGFGGCLADDMGLGKTVQVLALLESRRGEKCNQPHRPALVVVPRSLVFNWKQEAARFAPALRILDHTQPDRPREADALANYDLVLTTYGTLRRDAGYLKEVAFDYVILDEAQAVKNPASESAKAVRLLQGRHRLTLTGTPVQNHLGDLWSLFDFLNPGMLGAVSAFSSAGSLLRAPDQEMRALLSRGLRPFILRRTKEQVAQDLPAKLEQTLYCELEPAQRKLYDELREHYRQALLAKVASEGIGRSKIQILEALLRLRQTACHPGLIDKSRGADPSAKLDVLMPRLAEAHEEGHKALVFSQFTSFLSLLRSRLDKEKIAYQYLDGKTVDRQAPVERFQNDAGCKLFLISLKAGGLGLNLTAADYVFLLDPWWNPAIEAQAIDRTHRIGQTRQVFACRLIAKDTVEEKVLALQQSKRELADAIINADNSLIRTLCRDDLELLLS